MNYLSLLSNEAIKLLAAIIATSSFGFFIGFILYFFEHDKATLIESLVAGLTLAFLIRIFSFVFKGQDKNQEQTRSKNKK